MHRAFGGIALCAFGAGVGRSRSRSRSHSWACVALCALDGLLLLLRMRILLSTSLLRLGPSLLLLLYMLLLLVLRQRDLLLLQGLGLLGPLLLVRTDETQDSKLGHRGLIRVAAVRAVGIGRRLRFMGMRLLPLLLCTCVCALLGRL
jgi:hypothetical protein